MRHCETCQLWHALQFSVTTYNAPFHARFPFFILYNSRNWSNSSKNVGTDIRRNEHKMAPSHVRLHFQSHFLHVSAPIFHSFCHGGALLCPFRRTGTPTSLRKPARLRFPLCVKMCCIFVKYPSQTPLSRGLTRYFSRFSFPFKAWQLFAGLNGYGVFPRSFLTNAQVAHQRQSQSFSNALELETRIAPLLQHRNENVCV